MATAAILDYRRADQRTNVLYNPYWISSAPVDGSAVTLDDKYSVLFSFPAVEQILVLGICVQIVTAFTAGTTIDVGNPTLLTDTVTTGGVATTVDDDIYIKNGDITIGTPGFYWPVIGSTSVFSTNLAAGSMFITPNLIVGVAAAVPTISLWIANAATVLVGVCKVHALITKVPTA